MPYATCPGQLFLNPYFDLLRYSKFGMNCVQGVLSECLLNEGRTNLDSASRTLRQALIALKMVTLLSLSLCDCPALTQLTMLVPTRSSVLVSFSIFRRPAKSIPRLRACAAPLHPDTRRPRASGTPALGLTCFSLSIHPSRLTRRGGLRPALRDGLTCFAPGGAAVLIRPASFRPWSFGAPW
jgi:hypothetical protein